jgi:predicted SprT family Zn-dependent metalloprotease
VNITPDILHWAYEYLRHTPPFRRWGLPHADSVEFHVIRDKSVAGRCHNSAPTRIDISMALIQRTHSLIETMAHEMIHAHLYMKGVKVEHGADFKRCAALVCKHHGFDRALF